MYFFDTYALFEIIKGNQNYEKYKDYQIVVSILNIAELYSGLLRDSGEETSDLLVSKIKFEILDITKDLIIEAVKFRYKNRKHDMSLPDCIGYLLAKKHRLKFLTGDKEFKDLENVEFIK